MKNSHQHNRAYTRGAGRIGLLLVSLLAVAIVGADTILGGPLRSVVRDMAARSYQAAASVGIAFEQGGAFTSESALARENFALKERIAALLSLQEENEILATENAALRELTNAAEDPFQGITVPVLFGADASLYGTFLIGAGSEQGVLRGARVFGTGRVFLGTVTDVSDRTAVVSVLLAPGRETSGIVATSTSVVVTGRGSGNGIALVPRDVQVVEGDLVYHTDQRAIIGTVGSIESVPSSAQKQLFVRAPLNLNALRFVTLLPPL